MSGGGDGGGGGGDDGGGGGGGGPSKLAIVLIIIFVISLIAFFAQLFYVLWRRRVFHQRTDAVGGDGGRGDDLSHYSSSESNIAAGAYSKELLYFLCIRPQFLLERNSAASNSTGSDLNSDRQSDIEAVDFDLLKMHGVFGPPRFLFTIKEEEREATESPVGKSRRPIENEPKRELIDENKICLSSEDAPAPAEAVDIENRGVDDTTPFSTPCGSPLYFTPTASPVHEEINGRSGS